MAGAGPPPGAPLVSVVVATHGRPGFLEHCLESCGCQSYAPRELVVVLNPDDPASAAIAIRHGARTVRTHRNLGSFPALNLGIANSTGEFVMVIDDDARFESDHGLARLVAVLAGDPSAAAVTCNIRGPYEGQPHPTTKPVFLFKNGFTLYRRRLFTDVAGFFPDRFFRAGGETFLANHAYEAGLRILVVHNVWIYHAQTAVGRSSFDFNFYATRNHALLVVLQEPLVVVPARLLVKLVSSFVRIGIQRGAMLAWLGGWLSFAGNLGWALHHRRPVSLRTFLLSRRLTAEAGDAARVVVRASAEQT